MRDRPSQEAVEAALEAFGERRFDPESGDDGAEFARAAAEAMLQAAYAIDFPSEPEQDGLEAATRAFVESLFEDGYYRDKEDDPVQCGDAWRESVEAALCAYLQATGPREGKEDARADPDPESGPA